MTNKPVDQQLYNMIKRRLYKKMPTHSAYRSSILVKQYKEAFKKEYGSKKPYTGTKPKKTGLKRWHDEEWRNQRGGVGYKKKGDVYRPTKRITKKTPVTFSELSKKRIKTAMKKKLTKGRVNKF